MAERKLVNVLLILQVFLGTKTVNTTPILPSSSSASSALGTKKPSTIHSNLVKTQHGNFSEFTKIQLDSPEIQNYLGQNLTFRVANHKPHATETSSNLDVVHKKLLKSHQQQSSLIVPKHLPSFHFPEKIEHFEHSYAPLIHQNALTPGYTEEWTTHEEGPYSYSNHIHHFPPIEYGPKLKETGGPLETALTKALKFWIPTALFLTGASVLFPKKIKVPTNDRNPDPLRQPFNRQKRSISHKYEVLNTAFLVDGKYDEIPTGGKISHAHKLTENAADSQKIRSIPIPEKIRINYQTGTRNSKIKLDHVTLTKKLKPGKKSLQNQKIQKSSINSDQKVPSVDHSSRTSSEISTIKRAEPSETGFLQKLDHFHESQSFPEELLNCQKYIICELVIRGNQQNATKLETFLWSLAILFPDAITTLSDVKDTFNAVQSKSCHRFTCMRQNSENQQN